jgi:hypothetical protein
MNACGFRSMKVTLLLLGASMAIMGASALRLWMPRHELTIVIVDLGKDVPGRAYLRGKVATMVRKAVNAATRSEVKVRSVVASARDAKARFEHGAYDAALVIGSDESLAPREAAFVTVAGKLAAAAGAEPISLTISKNDPAMTVWLKDAFSRLLADKSFYATTDLPLQGLNFATVER